jgi:FkbM family methyltransferase
MYKNQYASLKLKYKHIEFTSIMTTSILSPEMKTLFDGLSAALLEYNVIEGFSFQLNRQIARLAELITKRNPQSILEIGFNGGHSALLFLAITPPETKVVSFDLGLYSHVFAAKRYIDAVFPGRHTLVTGDSTNTVPAYEDQVAHRVPLPPRTFDFLFVDGGHEGEIPLKDLVNCMRLASENHIVAMDDVNRVRKEKTHWNKTPTLAWELMTSSNFIIEEGYEDYFHPEVYHSSGRGMAWGRYTVNNVVYQTPYVTTPEFTMRLERLKYKHLDKKGLFELIAATAQGGSSYQDKVKLDTLAEMYLELFQDIDFGSCQDVLFHQARMNFSHDHAAAVRQYERLLDDPRTREDLKFYSMCNVGMLYPKNNDPIPKLIHLLFFGETTFHNFHHRCVHSMLQYMPTYKIKIYNVDEPENNTYWNDIKMQPNVEIVKIVVPEYYDGFELKHFQYKADVVRLDILYNQGGVYLDLDMLIVRNFEDLLASGHSLYLSKERRTENCLINAFMAAKPKNEFLRLWLNGFKSGLRMGIWAHHIRDTNKKLLDDHPHYMHKYNIKLLEGDVFFPLHWQDGPAFERSESVPYEFPAESYGTHLWETILGGIMERNRFLAKQKRELRIYAEGGAFYEPPDPLDSIVVSLDYFNDFRNDQFMNEWVFGGKRGGYFVEVGSTDGVEGSSCYYFEKNLDWNGVAVEPARCYAEAITRNRKRPIFKAVSDRTSLVVEGGGAIFYESAFAPLSGIRDSLVEHKKHQDWERINYNQYLVDTITLYDLLIKEDAPMRVDYCAIDAEGSELGILRKYFEENHPEILQASDGGHGGAGLVITKKVFQVDVFSIEIDDNYAEIKALMEANNYHEIYNPFLKKIRFQGREITWEKYFKHNNFGMDPTTGGVMEKVNIENDVVVALTESLETAVVKEEQMQPPPINAGFLRGPGFAQEVVVICLEERPERTDYVSKHLTSCGIPHTLLINNIHPTNTKVGCFRSHMKAIKYAKDKNLASVLILEDDVVIRPNIVELKTLQQPDGWDVLYLGGILTKYDGSDPQNKWVRGTYWCNHAYIVKNSMYDRIIEEYISSPDIDALEAKNIDFFYTEIIQKKYACWLAMDQYIIQKEGFSEIDGRMKWTGNFDWSTFSMKVI